MQTAVSFKNLLKIDIPILLAPMAGAADSAMAIAVANAGGLGSIACAMLSEEQIRSEVQFFRKSCIGKPLNLNFFCHENVELTKSQEETWLNTLAPYYQEFKVQDGGKVPFPERKPFSENTCKLVEELKPEVVSFHFGLPEKKFVERLKKVGCKIISSATTVDEASWLEINGCDAIIAQGFEAGGHRAMFLTTDVASQIGTMALVPLIVDKVKIPVIAAGGIGDGRGVVAAFALGAVAVQLGSVYLLTSEARISPVHKSILLSKSSEETVLTNLFTGKPARSVKNRIIRELGPISSQTPPFPYAGKALAPLKAVTEKLGSKDFMSLWSGQGIQLKREETSAEVLTKEIFIEAIKLQESLKLL